MWLIFLTLGNNFICNNIFLDFHFKLHIILHKSEIFHVVRIKILYTYKFLQKMKIYLCGRITILLIDIWELI